MKYLNLSIISLFVLSSCVFIGKPEMHAEIIDEDVSSVVLGDSITVDTVIGDFRLFYKISEKVIINMVALGFNDDESILEQTIVDKSILLNVQKLDTSNVVSYKRIESRDICAAIPNADVSEYVIDIFYLKEVTKDSVIFGAKLCMFEKYICKNIDIIISENGTIQYVLNNKS